MALIAVSIAALVLPLDPNALAREMDRRFRLPDHTTTAEELQTASGQGWHKLQYEDTVARLGEADWKKSWKIALPKLSLPAGLANAVLASGADRPVLCHLRLLPNPPKLLRLRLRTPHNWRKSSRTGKPPPSRPTTPNSASSSPNSSPCARNSRRCPIERLLSAMSKLENKLESLRQSAEKESLEPSANDIAEALANMEGQEATSAALRRKDFKKAAELADQSAKQMAKKGAATPKGADSPEAQQQFQKTAQKLLKIRPAAGLVRDEPDGCSPDRRRIPTG